MSSDFDVSQYLNIFLDEAEEQIQILDESIVQLEHDRENKELLNDIFRAAHTLKGSSASMGFQKMAEVTHKLESILDKIRQGEMELSAEIVDVLLECLDSIKLLKEEISSEGHEGEIDTQSLTEKLSAILEGKKIAPAPKKETKEEETSQINEVEKNLIREAYKNGYYVWKIHVTLEEDCLMKGPRAYIVFNNLENIGEIIKTEPITEDIEAEKFDLDFKVYLVTKEDLDNVKNIVENISEIADVTVEPVNLEGEVEVEKEPQAQKEKKEEKEEKAPPKKTTLRKEKIRTSQTVRVDVHRLENLMNLVGELVIDRIRLADISENLKENITTQEMIEALDEVSVHIGRITGELQEEIMKARMFPVEQVFNRFPRMVRDLARRADKEIDFQIEGRETELDRTVIEEIGDPLIHLIRNALDHGIEPREERIKAGKPEVGTVRLTASHHENQIIITVEDDGGGIDPEVIKEKAIEKGLITPEKAQRLSKNEALNLIFMPGFSTAKKVSDISGRGVGMDIVRTHIEKINGIIEIFSEVGKGTRFVIRLPLTLAINRSLLVKNNGEVFAFPLSNVVEIINVEKEEIKYMQQQEVVLLRGEVLPIYTLTKLLEIEESPEERDKFPVVVVKVTEKPIGVIVDQILGEQEIVIKSLGEYLGQIPGLAGATIMGDGKVALILDIRGLVEYARSEEITQATS